MKRAMILAATISMVLVMAVGCRSMTTPGAATDAQSATVSSTASSHAASPEAITVAASPRTAPLFSRRIMDGQVTGVNAATGDVALMTPAGSMTLHFPPSSLGNVKVGDHVTVEVQPANIP